MTSRLVLMGLLCSLTLGCSTVPQRSPEVVTKTIVLPIVPPEDFMQPCEYVQLDIDRDIYVQLSATDKEIFLFSKLKESIYKTAVCNSQLQALRGWVSRVKEDTIEGK